MMQEYGWFCDQGRRTPIKILLLATQLKAASQCHTVSFSASVSFLACNRVASYKPKDLNRNRHGSIVHIQLCFNSVELRDKSRSREIDEAKGTFQCV